MSTKDWAYLAGFIDAEGCIEASHGGKYVRVTVGQAYPEVLDWIMDTFGLGKLWPHKRSHTGYLNFRWRVSRHGEVIVLLQGILPHLKLKKTQAELALDVLFNGGSLAKGKLMKELKRPPRVSRYVEAK